MNENMSAMYRQEQKNKIRKVTEHLFRHRKISKTQIIIRVCLFLIITTFIIRTRDVDIAPYFKDNYMTVGELKQNTGIWNVKTKRKYIDPGETIEAKVCLMSLKSFIITVTNVTSSVIPIDDGFITSIKLYSTTSPHIKYDGVHSNDSVDSILERSHSDEKPKLRTQPTYSQWRTMNNSDRRIDVLIESGVVTMITVELIPVSVLKEIFVQNCEMEDTL